MAKKKNTCGASCFGVGLLSGALAAVSLWMLVAGFQMQGAGAPWLNVCLWYLGGFIVMGLAKKSKRGMCGAC
jgi:hypothetical protein